MTFVGSALVSALGLSLVAAAAVPEPIPGRLKLEAIEMNAGSEAGVVRTVAEVLGEPAGVYHFGAPHCRARTLGATMLEQLHVAMRSGQFVSIDASEAQSGGETIRCIKSVTFWAPST